MNSINRDGKHLNSKILIQWIFSLQKMKGYKNNMNRGREVPTCNSHDTKVSVYAFAKAKE